MQVTGKGADLVVPSLPLASPGPHRPGPRAVGRRWETRYDPAGVVTNEPGKLKAASSRPARTEKAARMRARRVLLCAGAIAGPPRWRASRRPRGVVRSAFAAPNAAQTGAWDAIASGQHALVSAPTGSGKTLAAFLWALDRLAADAAAASPGVRVLYVSPLKALAVDIERNLRAPLAGIRGAATRLGLAPPGDHDGAPHRRHAAPRSAGGSRKHPPDILVTTPESLFLLLTSAARDALRTVETVIVDEVHAVAGTKRGAHLALSLERLDCLLRAPGAAHRPVGDGAPAGGGGALPRRRAAGDGRRRAGRQAARPLDRRAGRGPGGARPADGGGPSGSAAGAEERHERLAARGGAAARADPRAPQHDRLRQLAAARRAPVRAAERARRGGDGARAPRLGEPRAARARSRRRCAPGRIPAVVATSSLELGIDMGAVDLVVQVEAPDSVATGPAAHRAGRAPGGRRQPRRRLPEVPRRSARVRGRRRAHAGRRDRGAALPAQPARRAGAADRRHGGDGRLDRRRARARRPARGAVRRPAARGARRRARHARGPLPVRRVRRAAPAHHLGPRDATGSRRARTRSGSRSRRAARSPTAGSTASSWPASARPGSASSTRRWCTRAGVGEVFLLGASSWRIEDITHDRVLVSPAPGQPGKMPFWRGDAPGRPLELGAAIGALRARAGRARTTHGATSPAARRSASTSGRPATWCATSPSSARRRAPCPTIARIVVERFRDAVGDWRVCVHSSFGARVHAPWARAIEARLRQRLGIEVQTMYTRRRHRRSACPTPTTRRPPTRSSSTPRRSRSW